MKGWRYNGERWRKRVDLDALPLLKLAKLGGRERECVCVRKKEIGR